MANKNARIKLMGTDVEKLDALCRDIKDIAEKTGTVIHGPIPLPTKRLVLPMKKGPDGGGTPAWDRWEMRIHKRIIDFGPNERAMRQIMRVQVPEGVHIEIEIPS